MFYEYIWPKDDHQDLEREVQDYQLFSLCFSYTI